MIAQMTGVKIRPMIGAAIGAALALMALHAPVAAAEDGTAPRRLLAAHEQLEWGGIGRLNLEGGDYCTATLVSESVAITAAHCMFDEGRRRRDVEVWFAAGYRDGGWQTIRQAHRTAVHPDYVPSRGSRSSGAQVAADVALIELDSPVRDPAIPHYPAAALPGSDGAVALLSYGRGRSYALSMQEPCYVTARNSAVLRLTCEVTQGSSGSPVFRRGAEGAPELVGVISGMGGGASYAVALEATMPALRAALELASNSAAASRPNRSLLSGARIAPTFNCDTAARCSARSLVTWRRLPTSSRVTWRSHSKSRRTV